jgi:hypothetical protein
VRCSVHYIDSQMMRAHGFSVRKGYGTGREVQCVSFDQSPGRLTSAVEAGELVRDGLHEFEAED